MQQLITIFGKSPVGLVFPPPPRVLHVTQLSQDPRVFPPRSFLLSVFQLVV